MYGVGWSYSVLFAPDTECMILVWSGVVQIQSAWYWLVSHGGLCLVCSRYKVHGNPGNGWSLVVFCVFVHQIQSAWYWLVSHGVLFLIHSRYKVRGIGWSLIVSCVLFAPDTKCEVLVDFSW